jgi:hypothetical protein
MINGIRQFATQGVTLVTKVIRSSLVLALIWGVVAAPVSALDNAPVTQSPQEQHKEKAVKRNCSRNRSINVVKGTATSTKNEIPPGNGETVNAISPYTSCRRQGRRQQANACDDAAVRKLAEEQGYELKIGPHGDKQHSKGRR